MHLCINVWCLCMCVCVCVHFYVSIAHPQARSENSYLNSLDLSQLEPLCTANYQSCREVVFRGRLAPGHYIIIPSTSKNHQEGEFLLRVLTEKGNGAV